MLYWVFDLDYTLYQMPNYIDFHYKHLKNDNDLNYLLTILPLRKVLYTNGTIGHAEECLNIMGLNKKFDKKICRETVNNIMKPNIQSFKHFKSLCNINKNDKVVFFEDSIENLIAAKKLGWITVLIQPNKIKMKSIDFWFPNIHQALTFFNQKIYKTK